MVARRTNGLTIRNSSLAVFLFSRWAELSPGSLISLLRAPSFSLLLGMLAKSLHLPLQFPTDLREFVHAMLHGIAMAILLTISHLVRMPAEPIGLFLKTRSGQMIGGLPQMYAALVMALLLMLAFPLMLAFLLMLALLLMFFRCSGQSPGSLDSPCSSAQVRRVEEL